MYIILSIVFITFLEIAAMIGFRLWEIKKGRINVPPPEVSQKHVSLRLRATVSNTWQKCKEKTGEFSFRIRGVMGRGRERFKSGSGLAYMKNMVAGRRDIETQRGETSPYLKDITAHKNALKEHLVISSDEPQS